MKNKNLEIKVDNGMRTYSMKFEMGEDEYMVSVTLKYIDETLYGEKLDLEEDKKIRYTFYKCDKGLKKENIERYEKVCEFEDNKRPNDKCFWSDNHNYWFKQHFIELCKDFALENKDFDVTDEKVYIFEVDHKNWSSERKVGNKIKSRLGQFDLSVYFEDGTVGIYNIDKYSDFFSHVNVKTKRNCIITDNQEELDVRIKNFKRAYIEHERERILEKEDYIEKIKGRIDKIENL